MMTAEEGEIPHAIAAEPDAELIRGARAGSTHAMAELFRRYAAMLHTVALRLLCDATEADDVVQDVFVALPEALAHYREQGAFTAWLRQLAVRTSLMRLRQRKRWVRAHDSTPARAVAASASVERIAVERALARLPHALRVVFVLKEIEGYSHGEIAQLHGISERASRVRLHRAWQRLRAELTT